MKFLDLCAGIGGFSLGLEAAGMVCIGQVEIDDYCSRILAKHWPDVQRWRDIKELDPAELPSAELICGGYPCQPFSLAGKRRGADDDRHLWPFISAIVRHLKPAWCLFENVIGHVSMGLDEVLSDLEGQGYTARPVVIPACAVNAPHRRDRVWVIANSAERYRSKVKTAKSVEHQGQGEVSPGGCFGVATFLPHSTSHSLGQSRIETDAGETERARNHHRIREISHAAGQWGTHKSCVDRVVARVPYRLDRLRALGNAVVPQVVYEIGKAIMGAASE
ncbi:MAG: DNA (cytosine-5-)-methyltransferase [Holophagales bacterium]|jgi:DNA (cytosine-5)-methyltransferase 1|nr:DNA (cytosine-5-)-methyltransferase [Holophagales bacterium]